MINVIAAYPVAFDSPDHTHPWGTMRDNHGSNGFVEEVEKCFNDKMTVCDLGCAGGQLVIDFLNRGHKAVGLEGSDYSAKNARANWSEYHNKNLFTCDISREYEIQEDGKLLEFDLITAWEVVEHINPDRLDTFFRMIHKHLKPEGIFVCSVSTIYDNPTGPELHLSVFPEEKWKSELIDNSLFEVLPYPYQHKVRDEQTSFYIALKRK